MWTLGILQIVYYVHFGHFYATFLKSIMVLYNLVISITAAPVLSQHTPNDYEFICKNQSLSKQTAFRNSLKKKYCNLVDEYNFNFIPQVMFQNLLSILKIYSLRYLHYRFSVSGKFLNVVLNIVLHFTFENVRTF